jgi:phenylacetate-CoA ligase
LNKNNQTISTLQPHIKAIIITSELCLPEQRKILEQASGGVPIYSEYGASEFGHLGEEVKFGTWRIIEENVFLEINPLEGMKEGVGEILVTDLSNKAFPFIRFKIGDIGRVFLGEDGRSYLTDLVGRTNDMVYLPSGKKAPGLTFYYISRGLLEQGGKFKEFIIRQIQLDTFVFEYVSPDELLEDDQFLVQKQMDNYLEPGLNLQFKKVNQIQRPANGKVKHFYSEIAKV